MQCSVNCNHGLLVIYAHRWFIKFAHFIRSLTFLFEFTDRSFPKTHTIIFQCGTTVNGLWMCMRSEHCLGPVSKHEFPSSTWFKRDRSSLRNIKWWNWNAFNPSSFTVATESTEGTGDKWKELFQEAYYAINFSCFLGGKIGLTTSDKNIIFVPLPRFLSEITHHFPSKRKKFSNNAGEGGRETWCVRHFVFFPHRRGGLHFLIGLCPKGSPVKIAHISVVWTYVSLWLCMFRCLLQEPIRLKVLWVDA